MDDIDIFKNQFLKGEHVYIRVTPNSSANKIGKFENNHLKIYITTVPEDGKANKAVISLISKTFKVPKSKIEIISGHKSKNKKIRLIV